jgi:hypothetical protein
MLALPSASAPALAGATVEVAGELISKPYVVITLEASSTDSAPR